MIQKIKQKLLEFFSHFFDRKEESHIEQKIIVSDNGEVKISINIRKQ